MKQKIFRHDPSLFWLLLLCAALIGFCQKGHGQDSTFAGTVRVAVIDSVLFVGDIAHYDIDENTHYRKNGILFTDGNHEWLVRENQRICLACLLWQKFHMENVAVYKYDPFYLAKKRILGMKK